MKIIITEAVLKKQYDEVSEVTIQHRLKITADKKGSYVTDVTNARVLPDGTLVPEVTIVGLLPNTEYVFKITSNGDKKNYIKEKYTTPEEDERN